MTTTATDLYDALTLAVNRADFPAGHLEERLSDVAPGAGPIERDLYALSIIAESVSDELQAVLDNARLLRAESENRIFSLENGRRPGKDERAGEAQTGKRGAR